MRLVTDTFAYCRQHIPRWNTISISGYHIREAGSTAAQELAFTLADGIAYVEAAIAVGLKIDEFAPRLSFFFNAHSSFFEEIAKFRAARRMWATIMRDRFGARDERSQQLRFHTQTAGSTLTSQQPLNNVVRTTIEALAAVLGGTQSLHTNGYDEALSLPTPEAATLALRTQQILAHESGVTQVADPLGGSYFVEALTDALERQAYALLQMVDDAGGAVEAIEDGLIQAEIADAAYETQQAIEREEQIVVGVNRFVTSEPANVPLFTPNEAVAREQAEALARIRAERESGAVSAALEDVRRAAQGTANLLVPMREALRARATLGEICGVLRQEWGEYRPEIVV
jgi:methylmalonyl-CoA mutase N-terminal domain/subunit